MKIDENRQNSVLKLDVSTYKNSSLEIRNVSSSEKLKFETSKHESQPVSATTNETTVTEMTKPKRDDVPNTKSDEITVWSTTNTDEHPISKSVTGSKVKITISKSAVIIKTFSGDVSDPTPDGDLQKTEYNNKDVLNTATSPSVVGNVGSTEPVPCDCIEFPIEESNNCSCPPKKSSFVIKLFRKKKCDDQCKCCTTTTVDKKKCKYYLEKKTSKSKMSKK